jgi:hypothetical protein
MAINALAGKVTSLEIKNRALQKLGVKRIVSETETSKNAAAVNACYDILRRAELRRHTWKFTIRRAKLNSSTDTADLLFEEIPDFDDTVTTYDTGQLVLDEGEIWLCIAAVTAGDGIPRTNTTDWSKWKLTHVTVTDYDDTATYAVGDIVYYRGRYYICDVATTAGEDPETTEDNWETYRSEPHATEYAAATSYSRGDLVFVGDERSVYSSRTNTNSGNDPESDTTNWVRLGFGVGPENPFNDPKWGRVFSYALPEDFLRWAPLDPKQLIVFNDYLLEGRNLVSDDAGPINIRYAADTENTRLYDPLFVEALAALIAFEVADELTNSNAKLQNLSDIYDEYIKQARAVDAIEQGTVESEEDFWETVRL